MAFILFWFLEGKKFNDNQEKIFEKQLKKKWFFKLNYGIKVAAI